MDAKTLNDKMKFMDDYFCASNASTGSKYDSNANVTCKNLSTLTCELGKKDLIDLHRAIVEKFIRIRYDEDTVHDYQNDVGTHIIYPNDESSLFPYCCSISLYPFILDGLKPIGGTSIAPKHTNSFVGGLINLIYMVASQFAGAVAIPEFMAYMDHFLRVDYGDDYVYHLDDPLEIWGNAQRTLRNKIEDWFQQLVHSINEPAGARNYQSPFTNIAYFDKYYFGSIFKDFIFPDGDEPKWETTCELQKIFMRWFNNERTVEVLTFPVETANILVENKKYKDEEMADFFAESWASGHSFFMYQSDSVDALASCCFSKDQKVLAKSTNGGVARVYFDTFENIGRTSDGPDRKNFEIFHNGSWCKGTKITLPNRRMYKVITSNNKEIIVSDNHLNVTLRGDVETKDLTENDYLMFNTQVLNAVPEQDLHLTYEQGFAVGASLGDWRCTLDSEELNMDCMLQSKEFRKGILDGWYNINGGDSNRCYTSSQKLAECMEALITSLGMNSIINVSDGTNKHCVSWYDMANQKEMEDIYKVVNNSVYFKIRSIEPVEYNDEIYCFEMDNHDEPYFTLPNGLITHNCRLRNEVESNVFSYTLGAGGIQTGSKNVITLNLNRIVQNWVREGKQVSLSDYIATITKRVHKYLNAWNDWLWYCMEKDMLPIYKAGFIDLDKQYLTVGVNGFVEGAEFLGIKIDPNDAEYQQYAKDILGTIKRINTEDRTEHTRFNTECVPGENLSVKLYTWDKADGYAVPKGRNLYNSYFYVVEDPTINAVDKFYYQGNGFATECDGGVALHNNLSEHLTKGQYRKLMDVAIDAGCNYFTYNIPNTICNDCKHIDKRMLKKCPKCGSENLDYATRVIGYLKRISNFSEARQTEANARHYASGDEVKT